MISTVRRRSWASADDGVAMITVLGVMTVVTLLAVGAFTLSQQALFDAVRAEDESRAFRAASAGLDTVISTFDPEVLTYAPVGTPDGTATIVVNSTGGDAGEYEVISSGVGIDGSTETVVQRFYYINLWEMNFAGTGSQSLMSGSSGMNGSSNIWGPFYIKGDLAVEANMAIMEGPLFVKGGDIVTQSGASQIGTPSRHVRLYCDGENVDLTKGTVYVDGPLFSVPTIELPKMTDDDIRTAALIALGQSVDGRMSKVVDPASAPENLEILSWGSSTYKFFGETTSTVRPLGQGNTTLHLGSVANGGLGTFGAWGSVTTSASPIPSGGTSSVYSDAGSVNVYDDFAYWDNPPFTPLHEGEHWDILFISGTVFVDGPLIIDDHVMYIGNGTIVANGPVTLDGALRPYSHTEAPVDVNKVGEDRGWALGIVTPVDITMNASGANNGAEPIRDQPFDYAGAFYTDSTIFVTHPGTSMRGSILSNKMDFADPNTDLVTNPLLPTYLPESLPGGGEGIISLGLWSRQ
ncbi:MAG: hypothetical protein JW733_06770 [Coriobacteriia bacterium]|nr:hypothetical protein [Coriobacteriia bacterium]